MDAKDLFERVPLYYAAKEHNHTIFRLLLYNRADPDQPNNAELY